LPRPLWQPPYIDEAVKAALLDWGQNDGCVQSPVPLDLTEFLAKVKRIRPVVRETSPGGCSCEGDTDTVKDGQYVCTVCGTVKDPVMVAPPVWSGTHTIIRRQAYDYLKYLDRHMTKLNGNVPHRAVEKIRAVFPVLYKGFFKVAPNRKNFMSYGFVLRKLLDAMCVTYSPGLIPTIKTKSRVRACESYWSQILAIVNLSGL